MHLIGEPAPQAALSILPETDAKKQQVWKDSLLLPAVLTGVLPGAELTAFMGPGHPVSAAKETGPNAPCLLISKIQAVCGMH